MATTANGIVYPVAGDFVAPLNTHFQDLAESVQFALDNKEGRIAQVVSVSYSTPVVSSTSTYVDTGLNATITPKFATSKILILVGHPSTYKSAGNLANGIYIQLLRGGTVLTDPVRQQLYTASVLELAGGFSFTYLDSPATTSATTYKTQFKNQVAAAEVAVQLNGSASTITLIEVSA